MNGSCATSPIRPRRDHAGREKAFDFGGEKQLPAVAVAPHRIEERTDADPVSCQHQDVLFRVPEAEGELAADMLEHAVAVLFPQVRQQLRVAVRAEAVAAGFEVGTHLGVLEQFAVVHDCDGTVLVGDRLPAVCQADDAQAA